MHRPCGDGSIDVKGTEVNSVNSLKVKHFRVFGQPSEGCLDTRIFLLREYIMRTINCLILLMSVYSRFVCTVFSNLLIYIYTFKSFALVFYLTKKIVRGSDPNVSHTLSFILCGMLLILDCCLTGIDCFYHIHIKLGFTFIGIQTV